MGLLGRTIRTIGSSSYPVRVDGAVGHNFERVYYKSACTAGDVRGKYEDLDFTSTGSGEMLRLRGIVSGTGGATGGTINALHATGRVASGGTVSGALNGIRATFEVAGTTPTPGGTLAAIQLDSNIVTGATLSANDAFIRITNSGATNITNLLNLPAVANGTIIAAHTTQTNTHSIKIVAGGTVYYIPCHATASGRS